MPFGSNLLDQSIQYPGREIGSRPGLSMLINNHVDKAVKLISPG